MKILMVCLGNICRSPMADGLLRKKVNDLELDWTVDSAGTANFHVGKPADPRMRKTALSFNVSLEELRARQFTVSDFDDFDLIYAMDSSNLSNILRLARNDDESRKVALILNELYPGKNLEVPDPYYGGEQGFVDVYNMLDEATDRIIEKLRK
jgi:protein-tyrosine phosphatase